MTTLVTGANGHVGCNVVRQLLQKGEDVRALVHRNRDALEGLDVEFVTGSINDVQSLQQALKGADTVIHAAAMISITGSRRGLVEKINVRGARHVADAALQAGANMVHVSSVHAFDLRAGGIVTETHPRAGPKNYAYDHSKFQGEQEVRAVVAQGLDACIVNPTAVIGPNDYGPSRMGQVFLDLRAKKMPALVRGTFDFVDVRDVAASIIAATHKGVSGENYLLGGTHQTIQGLAALASQVSGTPAPRLVLPGWAALLGVPFATLAAAITSGEPKFTRESIGALRHGLPVDSSKAAAVLGHSPRPLQQTIQDIYDWFEASA